MWLTTYGNKVICVVYWLSSFCRTLSSTMQWRVKLSFLTFSWKSQFSSNYLFNSSNFPEVNFWYLVNKVVYFKKIFGFIVDFCRLLSSDTFYSIYAWILYFVLWIFWSIMKSVTKLIKSCSICSYSCFFYKLLCQ